MSEAVLLEDVYSNFKAKKSDPYGKRGEKVVVITESETVLIVENKKGNRYPVHISKISKQ